jgi:opacity protein-like surface antigen
MNLRSVLLISCLLAAPVQAQDWQGEVYGGLTLKGSEEWYSFGDFDVDQGTALGFGVYRDVGGFELGVDVMLTDRTYTGFNNDIESVSLMANGRYAFPVSEMVQGYVGLGLGAIRVEYVGTGGDASFSGSDTVPGAQLSLGARFAVGTGSIFTELKAQTALSDPEPDSAEPDPLQTYRTTSVLVGYAFRF